MMREELAALMHEIWRDWMKYLFSKGAVRGKDRAHIIYPQNVQRWKRQMHAPYDTLSEKEKDSDREQADKVLALMRLRESGDRCVCDKCGQAHDPKLVHGGVGDNDAVARPLTVEVTDHPGPIRLI